MANKYFMFTILSNLRNANQNLVEPHLNPVRREQGEEQRKEGALLTAGKDVKLVQQLPWGSVRRFFKN